MTGPMLHTVDVDSDAQTIYEAITTKAGESAFWTSDCDIEPVAGAPADASGTTTTGRRRQ